MHVQQHKHVLNSFSRCLVNYVAMIYFELNTQQKEMSESFMSNKIGVDHPFFLKF